MAQRDIERAGRKLMKTFYSDMKPFERTIVKSSRRIDDIDKSIGQVYVSGKFKYGEDFRKHPGFQEDHEFIYKLEEEKARLIKNISRLEEKHGVKVLEVREKQLLYNAKKGYGGSF